MMKYWAEFQEYLIIKLAAFLTAMAAIYRPLKNIWYYMSKTKERMDKLDEIHDQVTKDGGLARRFEEIHSLVKRIEHVENLLTMFYNQSEVPIFICNSLGSNVFVNKAYCDLFDTDQEGLLGFGWRDYFDNKEYDQHWSTRYSEGRRVDYKVNDFHIQTQPIKLMDGEVGHFGTIKKAI